MSKGLIEHEEQGKEWTVWSDVHIPPRGPVVFAGGLH